MDIAPATNKDEIVIYQPEGAEFHIAVRVENETVWLTQAQMAELFHATKQNISLHIAKIFKEGELDPKVVVKEYLTTTQHGAIRGKTQVHAVKNYNLDVIISVGYRIKSIQGTRFRQWANQVLKEYMLKGYCINQRMLIHEVNPTSLTQQQKLIEKVDSRLTAVEQRVDFFVNTVHSAQNQKIEQLSNDVQKLMENFIDPTTYKHFLIFDGQRFEADVAYTKIYGMAKKSIIIIDNYVGVKTLDLLCGIAKDVCVQIFSEECGNEKITPAIKADYEKSRPDVSLKIVRPTRKFHDRYVFLDYDLPSEKLFHCGASSKDGGNKITTIMQIEHPEVYHVLMDSLTASKS